jgi:hypothetical protein
LMSEPSRIAKVNVCKGESVFFYRRITGAEMSNRARALSRKGRQVFVIDMLRCP